MTPPRLAALFDRYWAHLRAFEPLLAIAAGEADDATDLLRASPADWADRADGARALLDEADAIDAAGLNAADRRALLLLRRELRLALRGHALDAHLRPSLFPLGPEFALSALAGQSTLTDAAGCERYVARLRSVEAGLAGLRAALGEGMARGLRYPALAVERAIGNVRATLAAAAADSVAHGPLARAAARFPQLTPQAAEGLAVIEQVVRPALAGYAAFLAERLLPASRATPACTEDRDGEAFYRHLVEVHTTLPLDPEEVHALGLAEVERIAAAMDAVAAEAGHADAAAYRAALRADASLFAPDGEALLERLEILCKRVDARLPELFGRLPRAAYGVRAIPPAVAVRMPPAYAQPAPADNSAAGLLWVTSLPERCPATMHVPLVLHEGWPGHLMHIALMKELDGLPAFLRHGGERYAACLEGWALYCEGLGADMGFYDTPARRFGRLDMEMWRAVRLVVDTGLHARGWSREAAIDWFEAHVSLDRDTAAAEIDRYVALPGQALAYQVGNLRVRAMREDAEARLGPAFDLRRFHDALLGLGPATLDLMEAEMAAWAAAEGARAAVPAEALA